MYMKCSGSSRMGLEGLFHEGAHEISGLLINNFRLSCILILFRKIKNKEKGIKSLILVHSR